MVSNVDWLLPETAPKLGNIRDGRSIQRPKCVFVESVYPLLHSDLNAVCKKIVLTKKIMLLNSRIKCRVIRFSNRHKKGPLSRAISSTGYQNASR